MASITILSDGTEEKYALEAAAVTLGRGLESDIRLKDIKASRCHCQITRTPQGYKCLDLNSGNGTFVNGVQIKEQSLANGDKIQIGTTTITFTDQPKGATSVLKKSDTGSSKGTGAIPKVSAPTTAKVPVTAGAARPATQSTGKTSLVKPATGSIPATQTKITTKIGIKPATQSIPKGSTSVVKKSTQRSGSTRAVSATQKFHQEARKKKANPVVVLIVCIGVVFLAVVGFILFDSPTEDPAAIRERIAGIQGKAGVAYENNRFDEAVRLYKEALVLAESSDAFKSDAIALRQIIKDVETAKLQLAEADRAFEQFKAKFATATFDNARPVWDEGQKIKQQYGTADVPWVKELQEMLEKLDNMIRQKAKDERELDFAVVRNRIADKHKLKDKKDAQWGPAIREWKEYLSKINDDNNRRLAENELGNIQRYIVDDLSNLKRRAQRAVDENKKAEAVAELKQQRPRFEHSDAAQELETLIQEFDK